MSRRASAVVRAPLRVVAVLLLFAWGGVGWNEASAAASQQQPLRVACVGDSITHGGSNADSARNAWPVILQRLLDRTDPGRFETRNFGVPGACAFRSGNRPFWDEPEFAASQAWLPDIVILNFGTNDARASNWDPNGPEFERDYRDLVEVYRGLPGEPEVYLSNLTFLPEWFRYLDEVTPNRPHILDSITSIASDLGLGVIDFYSATAVDPLLVADGIHTSPEGNERVARWVHRAITRRPPPFDEFIRPTGVDGARTEFVAGGVASAALTLDSWTQQADWIEGTGLPVFSPFTCADEDFHVRARVRMLNQSASSAHLVLNGNRFGLESTRHTVFRSGPDFEGERFLFPSDALWTAGDWIDVELIRNQGVVTFLIEGRIAVIVTLPGPITSLGLAPGSSQMQVEEWSVTTAPRDDTPEALTRRTAGTPWVDFSLHANPVVLHTVHELRVAPAWLATAPGGGEIARVSSFRNPLQAGTLQSFVSTSTNTGLSWSSFERLPISLTGTSHRAITLADGRLAIAYWDRGAGSPTYGDLVLWVGTYEQLVTSGEGQFTCRLTRDWVAEQVGPYTTLQRTGPDDIILTSFARDPATGIERVFILNVPLDEIEALVPTGLSTVATASGSGLDLTEIGPALPSDVATVVSGGALVSAAVDPGQGGALVIRRSDDGGITWSETPSAPEGSVLDERVSLHRVDAPLSGERLLVWAGGYPARSSISDDGGATWSPLAPVGDFGGRGALDGIIDLGGQRLLGFFHDDGRFLGPTDERRARPRHTLLLTRSEDAGLTWSAPESLWSSDEVLLVEPCAIVSPDGTQLAVIAGDASGRYGSHVLFSSDFGETWSAPRGLPSSLAGMGHSAVYSSSAAGELVVTFRANEPLGDAVPGSTATGALTAWLGTFQDLLVGTPGRGRVRLATDGASGAFRATSLVALPTGLLHVAATGAWSTTGGPFAAGAAFDVANLDAELSWLPSREVLFESARRSGVDLVHTFRAPALTVTPNGTVVAAVDARRTKGDELPGDIDLVLRRSIGGSVDFEPLQPLLDPGVGLDVSQVSLASDPLTGVLGCATVGSFGAGLANSAAGWGDDSLRNFVLTSASDGLTWSVPVDITTSIKNIFWEAAYVRAGAGWRSAAGRWIIPVEAHAFGVEPCVHLAESDDGGATWRASGAIRQNAEDPALAERPDGSLVLTFRRVGTASGREVHVSLDQGVSWSLATSGPDPIEARSHAALTVLPGSATATGEEWLVLAGASAERGPLREDLCIFVSSDGGASWSDVATIHYGPAGEASLSRLPDGRLGVLFEAGVGLPYEQVMLARVPLAGLRP